MGLPDRDSASTWGGKLLVDRDGTEIGTCTQIFLDDATGLPEWAQADLSDGPGVVPLVDATASGDRVRVAVRRTEVVDAPHVDDPLHISQDEEELLYRHYGISFSREESESVLPVDEPVAEPVATDTAATDTVATDTVAAETVATELVATEPVGTEAPVAEPAPEPVIAAPAEPLPGEPLPPEPVPAGPLPAATSGELTDVQGGKRGRLLPALAAGAVGVLAVIAAAVFWWRRQHQLPPTRREQLAARAREASLTLGTRTDQIRTSAAPLLRTGRRLSASASQQAAVQARVAADRAAAQARVAADRAAAQARVAAEQAAALAAAARTATRERLARQALGSGGDGSAADERQRRDAVMSALQAFGSFVAGYAVRARAGRSAEGNPGRR